MQAKTTRAFRTISEAGDELGLQPHVLRFWESKFTDIKPIKRGGGRRFYRPEDIEFLRGIKTLLHEEGHPIKDVQKLIKKSGAARIVDLGRSVERASRDRDLTDMPLVPARIEKPVARPAAAVAPKSVPASTPTPAPVAESVVPAEAPVSIPEPTPAPAPAAEPLVAAVDADKLRNALGRLEKLRRDWDDIAKDAS